MRRGTRGPERSEGCAAAEQRYDLLKARRSRPAKQGLATLIGRTGFTQCSAERL
ncbi:MAG: hypothetical protein J6Z74_03020 [Eubacterium sp.]|nr:hypothetical protein [Eubacterium sp.]